MPLKSAIVALGSNLGDPFLNLQRAVESMRDLSSAETEGRIQKSSVWRTAPVGFSAQVPDFLNAVVCFDTPLRASELLAALKKIERSQGRERRTSDDYESRPLDLDIIDLGGLVLDTPGLTLPHPRAHERAFVLLPLQEIRPDYRFPTLQASLDELVQSVADQAIARTEFEL